MPVNHPELRSQFLPDEDIDPSALELAWSAEIKSRIKQVQEKKAVSISEEEFIHRLRKA